MRFDHVLAAVDGSEFAADALEVAPSDVLSPYTRASKTASAFQWRECSAFSSRWQG
jgi:hypothetical protein